MNMKSRICLLALCLSCTTLTGCKTIFNTVKTLWSSDERWQAEGSTQNTPSPNSAAPEGIVSREHDLYRNTYGGGYYSSPGRAGNE